MVYYAERLDLSWFQVRAFAQPDSLLRISVDHPENYIWSYDPIIRNDDINSGTVTNLINNWANQLIFDSTSWTGNDATAEWESPIIDIGWGWKPESIISIYDDRRDFQYVTTISYWRGADNIGSVSSLPWLEVAKNQVIDASCQCVQIKVVYITTDSSLTFPLIKTIKLSKKWDAQTGFNIPNELVKYTDGILDDTRQTGFWGLELSPLIDSTSVFDGWWTSPIHDFGLNFHPRWVSWYAFVPMGTYFNTLIGNNTPHVQIRGSNTVPISPWEDDHLPEINDPIWGEGTEVWTDIEDRESILDKIGMVRYAQIRIRLGVTM